MYYETFYATNNYNDLFNIDFLICTKFKNDHDIKLINKINGVISILPNGQDSLFDAFFKHLNDKGIPYSCKIYKNTILYSNRFLLTEISATGSNNVFYTDEELIVDYGLFQDNKLVYILTYPIRKEHPSDHSLLYIYDLIKQNEVEKIVLNDIYIKAYIDDNCKSILLQKQIENSLNNKLFLLDVETMRYDYLGECRDAIFIDNRKR
jgi:hypothetical protein